MGRTYMYAYYIYGNSSYVHILHLCMGINSCHEFTYIVSIISSYFNLFLNQPNRDGCLFILFSIWKRRSPLYEVNGKNCHIPCVQFGSAKSCWLYVDWWDCVGCIIIFSSACISGLFSLHPVFISALALQ